MPLPSTRPVHPRFSEHHRPSVTASMNAEVRITREGTAGVTGPDGTWTPPPRTVVYEGPARVSPRSTDDRFTVAGERRIVLRDYVVAVHWDAAEIRVDDLAEVLSADDPQFPGAALRVADVQAGGVQWERVLVCEQNGTEAGG